MSPCERIFNSICIHRNDTEKPTPKKEQPKIIFFTGTFNPVHHAHNRAVKEALKKSGADFAVVVADDRPNPWKSNRQTFRIRTEMLGEEFKNETNIFVAQASTETVRKALLENAYVIHLIGSDVFPRYKEQKIQQGLCHFPEVMVCLREEDMVDVSNMNLNVKVITQHDEERKYSSTTARNTLYEHDEWYASEEGAKDAVDALSMLPEDTVHFILKHRLYHKDEEDRCKAMNHDINAYIGYTHRNQGVYVESVEPGLSGNRIFTVFDKNKKPISCVKGFKNVTFKEDFANESKAFEILDQKGWKWVRSAELLWTSQSHNYCLLGQSYVEGMDMGRYWKSRAALDGDTFMQEMGRQAFCIGRALNELHNRMRDPMDSKVLEGQLKKLKIKADRILNDIEKKKCDVHVARLREKFNVLLENYRKNPGSLTYVHGDANSGNFFVNDGGTVTMIDLEGMGKATRNALSPAGFPAFEYYQFLSSLRWFPGGHYVTDAPVEICSEQFIKGYEEGDIPFTKEAKEFYAYFWQLRSL